MRVLIAVTHLLGSGHLRRSLNLAQAFARHGHEVTLISGGLPVSQFDTDGVRLVQLPPVQSDGVNFTRLLDANRSAVDATLWAAREKLLLTTVEQHRPGVVITELFPFGRRVLRAEFMNLLQKARDINPDTLILASVRDILAPPSSDKKALETATIIHTYYDAVLVHSDQETTSLERSWPVSEPLSHKLRYTGYVAQELGAPTNPVSVPADVIVSAGGGAVGLKLFEAAVGAAAITGELTWKILVGGSDAADTIARLKTLRTDNGTLSVEAASRDFRSLLQQARCSVSMCGYNTAIDLLLTGTPGVLVPFDDGGESEQTIRAESLARRSEFEVLLQQNLSPESLLQAVRQVCQAERFAPEPSVFDGAERSVAITSELMRLQSQGGVAQGSENV